VYFHEISDEDASRRHSNERGNRETSKTRSLKTDNFGIAGEGDLNRGSRLEWGHEEWVGDCLGSVKGRDARGRRSELLEAPEERGHFQNGVPRLWLSRAREAQSSEMSEQGGRNSLKLSPNGLKGGLKTAVRESQST